MLRLFRQYNKYFLAVGMMVLMVIFLIEGIVPRLAQSRDQPLGRIGSRTIYLSERNGAYEELAVISRVSPALGELTVRDPMVWLLMLEDAQRMGLSAGPSQVSQLLAGIMPEEKRDVEGLAPSVGASPEGLIQALEHWLVVQQYRELALGLGHMTELERVERLQLINMFASRGRDPSFLLSTLSGQPRVSEPLLQRFVQDQNATLKLETIAVPAVTRAKDVPEPDEKAVQELYDKYKDVLPGGDKGYGLGYKLPDRVKIEYITVPMAALRQVVKVDETDIYRYYDQYKSQFTTEEPPASQPGAASPPATKPATQPVKKQRTKTYLEMRDAIIEHLRDEAAAKRGDEVVKAIQAMLIDNAKDLAEGDNYRKVPAGWKGLSFGEVVTEIQKKTGVLSEVTQYDRDWLTQDEVAKLPGLGDSELGGATPAKAADYVMSVHELNPPAGNTLAQLHLQANLPSLPLDGHFGDRYIFRVTAADPGHVPKLSEIRAQVAGDARTVAAYEKIKAELPQWQERVRKESLMRLSSELGSKLLLPPSFQRRERSPDGALVAPDIENIGRCESFVDAVFALADKKAQTQPARNDSDFETILDAVPVDSRLTLFLVRISSYAPMTRSDYKKFSASPLTLGQIEAATEGKLTAAPFSVDELAKRVGFTWAQGMHKEPSPDDSSGN